MRRTCNENDPNTGALGHSEDKCGRTYDDLDHLTYCPHAYFPPGPAVVIGPTPRGARSQTRTRTRELGD